MKQLTIPLLIFAIFMLFIILGYLWTTNNDLKEQLEMYKNTQESIDLCIDDAHKNYKDRWDAYCKNNDIKLVNGECLLPGYASDPLDKEYETAKQFCVNRYK